MPWQTRAFFVVALPLILGCGSGSEPLVAAVAESSTTPTAPAIVAEAVKRLDLAILPTPAGGVVPGYRREAQLSYNIKSSAQDAFDFAHRQLVELGWKQLPDAQNHGDFVSANYRLDGFLVSLSVSPRQSDVVGVMLTHHGNVALVDVPVPANVEKMHAFPAIVMYKSPDDVATTAAACREQLLSAGWSPYGGAGDTVYYRQNAVQVDVGVMSAPAQGGATVISISSKLLSLELPAPPFTDNFRYSDGTTAIDFDTDKSPQAVADFYREKLEPQGWKATTDKPFAIDWKEYTIFRNADQAMITIATHEFEGRTRVNLDHQNAAEFADEELRGKIAFGEKAKYRDVEWQSVALTMPADAETQQLEDWAIKSSLAGDQVFATAEELAKTLEAAGWEANKGKNAERAASRPVFREHRLEQGDRALSILALKHHKLNSWVAVIGLGGVNLKVAE